ncbi:unnamed protein product, partial [Meganyctiphanes norvegica]
MLILICIMSQRHCLTLLLTGIMLSVSASRKTSECGDQDLFITDSGKFQYPTPNTGQNYPNKDKCIWNIETSGGSIELYFTQLDTEEYCDTVVIRDGDFHESSLLGNFSGNTLPGSVKTTKNKAYIKFTSGKTNTGKGFILNWKPVDSSSTSPESDASSAKDAGIAPWKLYTTIGVFLFIVAVMTAIIFVMFRQRNSSTENQQNDTLSENVILPENPPDVNQGIYLEPLQDVYEEVPR